MYQHSFVRRLHVRQIIILLTLATGVSIVLCLAFYTNRNIKRILSILHSNQDINADNNNAIDETRSSIVDEVVSNQQEEQKQSSEVNGVPRAGDLYVPGHTEANSNLCGPNAGENLRVLILVTSAPTHHAARLAIRQTWGHYASRRDVALAFMIGATKDQSTEDSLKTEFDMYNDFIRGRFIDHYYNLTLKTISSLEWVDKYCSRVSFILKIDDDMFLNGERLLSFIDEHRSDEKEKIIYGYRVDGWGPHRSEFSKYYLSPQEYPSEKFPPFTCGPAYLLTGGAVHDLYEKSLEGPFVKLEDVYITGVAAELAKVERKLVSELLCYGHSMDKCFLRKSICFHSVYPNDQFGLWKALMGSTVDCDRKKENSENDSDSSDDVDYTDEED